LLWLRNGDVTGGGGDAFFSRLTAGTGIMGKAKDAQDRKRTPVLNNPDKARFKRQKLELDSGVAGLPREGDSTSNEDGEKVVAISPL
jgi:hypothetical protein